MQADARSLSWSAAADAAAALAGRWGADEPGGAIFGFDGASVHFARCGGVESLATGAPFSARSVVRIASVTKHIFNTMLLRHAGEIGLDDPLGRHLPFLKGDTAAVSVGRALDMTGGLPDVRETMSHLGIGTETVSAPGPIFDFIAAVQGLNFAPGAEVSYSNTGYRLVEHALVRKGHAFQAYLDATVNGPLGIRLTAPDLWTDPVPGLVPGYWRANGRWQLAFSGIQLSASGCITASGEDLVAWTQALMTGRLGADVLPRLTAPRSFADGRPSDYRLGLARSAVGGMELVGHGGSHLGYKTYVLFDPARQAGVVVVSNREDTAPYPLALEVAAALFGAALPARSRTLPDGLYAAPSGPEWLEVKDGVASFLGTGETLYESADGAGVSLSAHFPMRLRWTGEAVEGEVGAVARRFLPVRPGASLKAFEGSWRQPDFHAHFEIRGERMVMGVGPAVVESRLIAIDATRAIAEELSGPWPRRACLVIDGDSLLAASNRSRVLRFQRGA